MVTPANIPLAGHLSHVLTGAGFLFAGAAALVIAALRRSRLGAGAVFWVGLWSAIYGINGLIGCSAVLGSFSPAVQSFLRFPHTALSYLTLVTGALAFRELTRGLMRRFLTVLVGVGLLVALLGIAAYLATGNEYALQLPNQIVATVALAVLLVVLVAPPLWRRYSVWPDRGLLLAGSVLFCAEALGSNFIRAFWPTFDTSIGDDLGFAVLLLALAYGALHQVYRSELRLAALDNEMAMARQLQRSILPAHAPEVRGLRVAALYEPMTAVAGDYYEFLPVDESRCGFLVADVSGHGVPAALVASMIKVAVKSVAACAAEPGELLRRLRAALAGQLQGQYITVAYLWIDTAAGVARYSAAGHPPLVQWRAADGSLAMLASNGLPIGLPLDGDFPVLDLPLGAGDRLVLSTDGLTEPENAQGEAFGERRMGELLAANPALAADELASRLLGALRAWLPAAQPQADDITVVVIEVNQVRAAVAG